ncbi:MAG: acyl--CoA ligase, partial [Erysipelotrichaceae bacterium]|nr:acyl--CoA ligase [Erysipelotrichaceae bacterium]
MVNPGNSSRNTPRIVMRVPLIIGVLFISAPSFCAVRLNYTFFSLSLSFLGYYYLREQINMNQVYKHPHLVYPELTMFQMVENIVKQYPDSIAYEFFGKKTDYAHFLKYIEQAARAFRHIGISKGDAVTICMPNVPQGLIAFYALDRIGAVANMVHPLSAESEIVFYLNISESRAILTMDMFAEKVERAVSACDNEVKVILARMTDELPVLYGAAFLAKTGRKFLKYPNTSHAMTWKEFLNKADRKMSLPAVR